MSKREKPSSGRSAKRRLRELRRLAAKAIAAADLPAIESYLAELDANFPTTQANSLRADLRIAVNEIQNLMAIEQAKTALANMATAYAAHDFIRADAFERQYRQAKTSPHFKPTPEMASQLNEAHRWLEDLRKTRAETQRIESMIATIRAELNRRPPSRNLAITWRALQNANAAVNPALAKRVLKTLAVLKKNRRRRIRFAATAGAAALVIVFFGATLFLPFDRNSAQERTQWLAAMDQAATNADLAAFDAAIKQAKANNPALLESYEFRRRLARRPAIEGLSQERLAGLRRNLALLQDELQKHPARTPQTKTTDILAAVERDLPIAKPEDLEQWEQLRPAITALKTRKQLPDDPQLVGLLDRLDEIIPQIESNATISPAQTEQLMPQARELVAQAANLQNASPELQAQADAAKARLAEITRSLRERKAQLIAIEKIRELPDYLAAIKNYATAFQNDAISPALLKIAEYAPVYNELLLLRNHVATNADFHLEALQDIAAAMPENAMFWQPTMQQVAERERELKARWPNARQTIMALATNTDLLNLSSIVEIKTNPTGPVATNRAFLRGTLQKETTAGPQTFTGNIYFPKPEDTHPVFRATKLTADSSGQLHVKIEPMPHCLFIKKFLREMDEINDENADIFLAHQIADLATLDQAGALMRARVINVLLTLLQSFNPEPPPDWALAQNELAALDPNLGWLCERNQKVIDANQQADEILQNRFVSQRLGRRYIMNVLTQRASIGRGLFWAGYASFEDSPRPILLTTNQPPELWIVTGARDTMPILAVAVEFHNNETKIKWPIGQGTLFFAPSDGRTTEECLRMIRDLCRLPMPAAPDKWPPAWPGNRQ